MKWSILSSTFLAVCLAGGPAGLSGFTVTVDCGGAGDVPTIQAGIDMAADGDTVQVAPCTYTGLANRDIQFNGKAIVVMSSDGPEATIIDCQGLGRGFYFDQNATSASVLDGFTIQNGTETDGGGIKCWNADPTIRNCIITACSAYGDGGGIHLANVSPTIADCTIDGNSAADNGGGIYLSGGSPNIDDCTIRGNDALYGGGGIHVRYASPTITGCMIANNSVGFTGGGIHVFGGSPDIDHCTLQGNTASDGGGIYASTYAGFGSGPGISNCTFTANSVDGKGGGIHYYAVAPQYTDSFLWGCRFTGNSADYGGGGIYLRESKLSIYNCLLDSNVTTGAFREGGGIYVHQNSEALIHNCTLLYNDSWFGGGVYSHDSNTTMFNCIVYWNTATSGNSIYYYPDSPTVTYSDIEGGWAGTGNVDTDPLFAEAIDFHLASGSPCVDAGDPSIVDGSRPPGLGGTRSDMGAYGGSQNGEWLEGVYDLFLYPTGPTTVTVGDTLFFDALIWNSTANPATGNYWLSIVLPNQSEVVIPSGLLNFQNPAYGTTAAHGTNTLSNELRTILTGTYTLIARIGVYPNTVVDEESIEIEVLP